MGPPKRVGPDAANAEAQPTPNPNCTSEFSAVSSQQVSWWDVREFVTPMLEQSGSWPMAGTPAWCLLGDDDPVKLAALFDAAQHPALRVETCQQAACQASRDISAAADWSGIAREIRRHNEFYAEKPWLKRVAS